MGVEDGFTEAVVNSGNMADTAGHAFYPEENSLTSTKTDAGKLFDGASERE